MDQLPRSAVTSPAGGAELVRHPSGAWYRFRLWRQWGEASPLPIVMLNPSVADADTDDHTIRRCCTIARDLAYGGITVVNLFALVDPDPRGLLDAPEDDPVGLTNGTVIRELARQNRMLVAAWGAPPSSPKQLTRLVVGRVRVVHRMVLDAGAEWRCFGTTAAGHPRHPSRLGHVPSLLTWSRPT